MTPGRHVLLSMLLCIGASAAAGVDGQESVEVATVDTVDLPVEGNLPSLDGATAWLDTPPLTRESLRGKVVLVDFWTYSCINSLRQFPYVRAWASKYKDQGLVVIGVHAPEFAFERDPDNVRLAIEAMHFGSPVLTAIDSRHAIWQSFNNNYWPALYFIDAKGHIRHHVYGEGAYDASERVIQQLLREAGAKGVSRTLVTVEGRGVEAPPDWPDVQSPETYIGSARRQNFVSTGGGFLRKRSHFALPELVSLNHWALAGDWTVDTESASLNEAHGHIVYRFHARDLNLVMAPSVAAKSVHFRVLIDGKPPGSARGIDVDDDGYGTVTQPRMYQLLRQPLPIADHQFDIEFLEPGVEAFVFTFG